MARPLKEGWDYFPLEINLDKKIQAIESVYKNDGFVWIIKFWQEAYRHNNGEVRLDGYHGVIHVENCRITMEKHLEILKMCLEIGLLYETNPGFYTSNGLQKRISFLTKERARYRKYKGNENNEELSTVITPVIRGESKVKESKLNKIYIDKKSSWYKQLFNDFPQIDVDAEYDRAMVWEKDNPRKDHKRFFKNWLLNCKPKSQLPPTQYHDGARL